MKNATRMNEHQAEHCLSSNSDGQIHDLGSAGVARERYLSNVAAKRSPVPALGQNSANVSDEGMAGLRNWSTAAGPVDTVARLMTAFGTESRWTSSVLRNNPEKGSNKRCTYTGKENTKREEKLTKRRIKQV